MAEANVVKIERKRADALIRIGQHGIGTALAGTVPTPALELTKQIGIALSDAWMFWDIYKTYYNEELSAKKLRELLGEAGIIVVTGGVIGYGAVRISQSLLGEVLNLVPVAGWLVSGAISGATSVVVGLAWMVFVEDTYRNKYKLSAPVAEGLPQQIDTSATEPLPEPLPEVVADDAGIDDDEAFIETGPKPFSPVAEAADDMPAMNVTLQVEEQTPNEKVVINEVAVPVQDVSETTIPDPDDGKVLAENPDPDKEGTSIDRDKYEIIRNAIVTTLQEQGENGEMALKAVVEAVKTQLPDFDGSVNWYVTTVKLDLEAKNIIERVPNESPQRIRLLNG